MLISHVVIMNNFNGKLGYFSFSQKILIAEMRLTAFLEGINKVLLIKDLFNN